MKGGMMFKPSKLEIMYKDDDVVITDENECMTYAQSKQFHCIVFRIATKKEALEYNKECEYWRKQGDEEEHEGSYHELPD